MVVSIIARQVLRDAVRTRLLYGATLLAIGLSVGAPIVGRLSAGQDVKVVKDLGLAACNACGLFVVVFLGVRLVAREIEQRTVDARLSKPIRRCEFVLGQYGGLVATLALALTATTVAMYGVLGTAAWWRGVPGLVPGEPVPVADPALLKAILLIFVQLAVVGAAALCLSTFSSPVLAAVSACGLYVAGHFGAALRNLDAVVDSRFATSLAAGLSYVLPDLGAFDVQAAVVHGQPVTAGYLALSVASGAAYILAFLVPAVAIRMRRDLP